MQSITRFSFNTSLLRVSLRASLLALVACVFFAIEVDARNILPPPKKLKFKEFGRQRSLHWKRVKHARAYRVRIYDVKRDKLLHDRVTFNNQASKVANRGEYYTGWLEEADDRYLLAKVATIDKNGETGTFTDCVATYIEVKYPDPGPIEAWRHPFCGGKGLGRIKMLAPFEPERAGRNKAYKYSFFQMEGASFLISNNDVADKGESFAAAMVTSLRGMYWINRRHGFEGSVKTKLVDYTDLASEIQPLQIEGRYHMRFQVPFPMKSIMEKFQLSLFAGYEYYQNNSTQNTIFTTGYQLAKAGLATSMPIFSDWHTGGEAMFGMGPGGNMKIEMQGFLNYFVAEDWSLGVGYRVHLLRVEDEGILPEGVVLPIREVYGEAYGKLRFSF